VLLSFVQTTIYLDGIDPESGDGMESLLTSSGAGGMAMAMDMDGIPAFSADSYDEGDARHRSSSHDQVDSDEEDEEGTGTGSGSGARKKRHKGGGLGGGAIDSKVKIALSLYKVQQNIYLLDFQRVEVSVFSLRLAFYVLIIPFCQGRCIRLYETLRVHHYRTQESVCSIQSVVCSFVSAGSGTVNGSQPFDNTIGAERHRESLLHCFAAIYLVFLHL
jgi:hypothetical protein